MRIKICGLSQSFRRVALSATSLLLEANLRKIRKLHRQMLVVSYSIYFRKVKKLYIQELVVSPLEMYLQISASQRLAIAGFGAENFKEQAHRAERKKDAACM